MPTNLTRQQLAAMIDHTCLKPDASYEMMETLCKEAEEMGCAMVAINSCQTALCAKLLENSPVHTGAAISFPLGQTDTAVKLFETEKAIQDGADEIDYVVCLSDVRNGNWEEVRSEMEQITALCHSHDVICKVIFETCYLSRDEIIHLAQIAREVEPDFIKTSTGFGSAGATVENVRLMKEHAGDKVQVKAAGGIRTLNDALAMIEAGASRLGTSSAKAILTQLEEENAEAV